MKKAAFKFKSGSGAIFAFLILAFVFASIAGVVYLVISKSPSKTPQASTASCRLTSNPSYKGERLNFSYSGFAPGESILLKDNLYASTQQDFGLTLDSLSSTRSGGAALTAHPGVYTLLIRTRYPIANYPCGTVTIIDVTACSFTPQYVNVGASARVMSDGYGLPVSIKNRFDGRVFNLNSLNGDNNNTDVTIPTSVYPNPYDMYLKKPDGTTFPCTTGANNDHLWVTSTVSCLTFRDSADNLRKYGDVNNNNVVNASDSTLVRRSIFGIDLPLVGDAKKAADVNGNGIVNASDSTLILKFVGGDITKFPIPGCT